MESVYKHDIYLSDAPFIQDKNTDTAISILDLLKGRKVVSLTYDNILHDNLISNDIYLDVFKSSGYMSYDQVYISKNYDVLIVDRRIGSSNIIHAGINTIHDIVDINPNMQVVYIYQDVDFTMTLDDYILRDKSLLQKALYKGAKFISRVLQ